MKRNYFYVLFLEWLEFLFQFKQLLFLFFVECKYFIVFILTQNKKQLSVILCEQ